MEANAPWRDEELLRQKYVDDGLSTRDLEAEWDCCRSTITNWLDKYGIETPSNPDNAPWQDKETLEKLYIDEGLTCPEIGDRFGVSGSTVDEWRRRLGVTRLYKREQWLDKKFNGEGLTIREIAEEADCARKTAAEWLDKLGVRSEEDRPADYVEEKAWHDPEMLKELYHGEELSAKRVADRLGCSPQTVRHWLIEFGIPRRSAGYTTIEREGAAPARKYPMISGDGETILLHRFVAFASGEMSFEELCDPQKVVHHRTNIPWDNRPENLTVMDLAEHTSLHASSDYEPEVL